MTVFCWKRGLHEWQFYDWKKRLRPSSTEPFAAVEATDMRCGFNRLAERVQTVIGESPLNERLFQ